MSEHPEVSILAFGCMSALCARLRDLHRRCSRDSDGVLVGEAADAISILWGALEEAEQRAEPEAEPGAATDTRDELACALNALCDNASDGFRVVDALDAYLDARLAAVKGYAGITDLSDHLVFADDHAEDGVGPADAPPASWRAGPGSAVGQDDIAAMQSTLAWLERVVEQWEAPEFQKARPGRAAAYRRLAERLKASDA